MPKDNEPSYGGPLFSFQGLTVSSRLAGNSKLHYILACTVHTIIRTNLASADGDGALLVSPPPPPLILVCFLHFRFEPRNYFVLRTVFSNSSFDSTNHRNGKLQQRYRDVVLLPACTLEEEMDTEGNEDGQPSQGFREMMETT